VPAPEAVAAAAAKEAAAASGGSNSDTIAVANSLKTSGENIPSRNRAPPRQPNRRTTSERS